VIHEAGREQLVSHVEIATIPDCLNNVGRVNAYAHRTAEDLD
jgi:hypothetical protein